LNIQIRIEYCISFSIFLVAVLGHFMNNAKSVARETIYAYLFILFYR